MRRPPWMLRTIITNTYHSNWFCASESEVFFVLRVLQGQSENQMRQGLRPQPILGMESELYKKKKRSIMIILKSFSFCSARGWYKYPKSMRAFSSCDTQTDLKFRVPQQYAYLLCFSINTFHSSSV